MHISIMNVNLVTWLSELNKLAFFKQLPVDKSNYKSNYKYYSNDYKCTNNSTNNCTNIDSTIVWKRNKLEWTSVAELQTINGWFSAEIR